MSQEQPKAPELYCPRCGTESELTQSQAYPNDPRVFIRCMGVCDLESPLHHNEKTAIEWWTKPFTRPAAGNDLIEAAKQWLEANTPLRWLKSDDERDESERDIPLERLNGRQQKWAERMAAFAQQVADARSQSVWIVRFSSYYPREIYSIWATKELAERQARALGIDWDVEEWAVQHQPDDAQGEKE